MRGIIYSFPFEHRAREQKKKSNKVCAYITQFGQRHTENYDIQKNLEIAV